MRDRKSIFSGGQRCVGNIKKGIVLLLVFLFTVPGLTACEKRFRKEADGGYKTYYINEDGNELLGSSLNRAKTDPPTPEELCAMLVSVPEGKKGQKLLPDGGEVKNWDLSDGMLEISVGGGYLLQDNGREILARAGLVRAFGQLEDVKTVKILVDGIPLKDQSGKELGLLKPSDFVEVSGNSVNSYQQAKLHLFFVDSDGHHLKQDERTVYYSKSAPLERVVVEEVIKGPYEDNLFPTITTDLKVLSVTNSEGICYVSFDSSLQTSLQVMGGELFLQAVVQSLHANCHVDKVQFSINGDTTAVINGTLDLNRTYEPDDSFLLK